MTPIPNQDTEVRTQVRGSAILLGGRLVALLLNLLVQIFVVRYLAKNEYGSFAYAMAMVALATNVSLLGLDKALARFMSIYHETNDMRRAAGTVVLVLATVAGFGLAIAIGVIGFGSILGAEFVSDPLSLTLLLTLILLAPIDGLNAVLQSVFGVFGDVKTVFIRRYVLGPLLKLVAIIVVVMLNGSPQMLAICYLAAGVAGMLLYVVMSIQIFEREKMLSFFRRDQRILPAKEVFSFSLPLLSNQLSFLSRTALVVLFLEALHSSVAVADFRSIVPFARLNLVVISSFSFLFTPLASRMFSREDGSTINHLYWTSAIWVMVLTFPAFMLTSVFAEPLTLFMFEERYAGSAIILSLLSVGFFFDAALGFTVQTLRVQAKVKYIVVIDVVCLVVSLVLYLLWIPAFGATGAAFGAMIAMVLQNVAYFACMKYATGLGAMEWKHAGPYLSGLVLALLLLACQYFFHPHLFVAVLLVAIASLALLISQRRILEAQVFFPEALRIPIIGRLLSYQTQPPSPEVLP